MNHQLDELAGSSPGAERKGLIHFVNLVDYLIQYVEREFFHDLEKTWSDKQFEALRETVL